MIRRFHPLHKQSYGGTQAAGGLAPTAPEPDNAFVLLYYVSGVCNGCQNGITLNNQVI
jgi:hypothetical protein